MSRTAKKKMRRWLEHYISNGSNEPSQEQGQRQPREYNHNPDWQSHKYDLSDWRSAQQIYLPELGMKLGPATNKMKKLWRLWHKAQREGTPKRDHAYNIAKIQHAIGLINPTQFEELQDMDLDLEFGGQQMEEDEWTQGLSQEEWEARQEELAEEEEEKVEDFYPDIWADE